MKFGTLLIGPVLILLVYLGGSQFDVENPDDTVKRGYFSHDRIVFDSNRSGTFGIYSMRMDGSDVRPVSDSEQDETNPAVAPDGTLIAFLKTKKAARDVPGQLWVTRPDGSKARMITRQATYPVFSANSKKLYYIARLRKIKSIDLDTGKKQLLFPTAKTPRKFQPQRTLGYLNASPNGQKLAFVSYLNGAWTSLSLDLDTKEPTVLTPGCQPFWTTDSTSIVFISGHTDSKDERRIMRYNTESGNISTMYDSKPPWGYEYFPSITHDERYLLFSESRFDQRDFYKSNFQIFLQDLSNHEVIRLQNDTFTNRWPRFLPAYR